MIDNDEYIIFWFNSIDFSKIDPYGEEWEDDNR